MSDARHELDELLEGIDDDDAATLRARALAAAMPAPVSAHLPFIVAANKLRSDLLGLVDQLVTSRDMGVLLTGSAGVGKTESMLAAAAAMLDRAQPVVWAAPTIEMAHETADRAAGLGIQAEVLHGRNATTCSYMDKVLVARAEGYAPGAYVCPSCPKHPDNLPGHMLEMYTCGHYAALARTRRAIKQAKDRKVRLPLIVTTYENAVAGLRHASGTRQGDIWKTRQVFFDEDPSRAMRERAVLSDEDLTRTPREEAPSNLLRIFSMARAIAADERMVACAAMTGNGAVSSARSVSHDFSGSSFSGRELHRVLFSAADALSLDLETCLARGAEWATKLGKGDLFYADVRMLKYVVNAFLPKLAETIHREITYDYSGTPSTYAVRLESSKEGGWQYVLDRLVPFRSGQDNIVVGDAYADKDFVKSMFGGRPMATIEVRVALPDNVRVMRSTSAKTTKSVLKIKQLMVDLLETEVSTVLQAEAGRRLLVYTHLGYKADVEDWFASNHATYDLTEVAFEHYWSGRGKDQYKHFDSIMCVGEPVPNLLGMVHEANALHPDQPEILWSPDSKKIWSQDYRLERVWNMLATQEMSQALMRIRPGIPSANDKRMYIFGKQVPLPPDFMRALHALGHTSTSGDDKMQEGEFIPVSPEAVRDYILWVFSVTGCWCNLFLACLCKSSFAVPTPATILTGADVDNVLRPPPVSAARLRWLRAQHCVKRGIELAERSLSSPSTFRPSWRAKRGPDIEVFGDVSSAARLIESLYHPSKLQGAYEVDYGAAE